MEDKEEDDSEPDFEPLEAPAGYINTRRILSMFGRVGAIPLQHNSSGNSYLCSYRSYTSVF